MAKRKGRKTEGLAGSNQSTVARAAAVPVVHDAKLERPQWKLLAALAAIITFLVVAIYADTLWMGTVFNDNATFQQLNLRDADAFFSKLWLDAIVRPLTEPWTRASFALDIMNYRANFGWYHFVNIFLHLSACLALFVLLLRIGRHWQASGQITFDSDSYWLAFVAAALYACHPLAAEPVTYISKRPALLAAANFLLALNGFTFALLAKSKAVRIWGYALAVLFAIMCVESGPVGVILPATMIAFMFLCKPDSQRPFAWMVRQPITSGVLIAVAAVLPFAWINGIASGAAPHSFGMARLDSSNYVATQAKAFVTYYTRSFFVPVGLSVDPPYTLATTMLDPFSLLGLLILAGVVAAIYHFWRQRFLAAGLVLLLSGYLPQLLLVQQERVADSAFYLSLSGLCTVAAWFLVRLLSGTLKEVAIKFALLVVLLGGLSVWHNLEFAADEKLIAATLNTNHSSAQALTVSSMNSSRKKNYQQGLELADQAILSAPDSALAYVARGAALNGLKHYEQAAVSLEKAVSLAEKQRLSVLNEVKLALAENYVLQKKPFAVGPLVYPSLSGNADNARALYLLGMAAHERHSYQEAYMYLSRAAQSGSADALVPLSDTALRTNNTEMAFKLASMAVDKFDTPETQRAYGAAALATNQLQLAGPALVKALKGDPQSAEAMALLAIYYDRKNDKVLAASYRKDALSAAADIFSELPLPEQVAPAAQEPGADRRSGGTSKRWRH